MSNKPIAGQEGRRVVSAAIRRALFAGDMVPGQRLIEQELSTSLNAARAAVREALQDLAAEGLVELIPRRGARVRIVTVEEALQITECRASLEGLCARRAADLASVEDRGRLRRIGERMRAAVASGDLSTYSTLNTELHSSLAHMSGQAVAEALLNRLKGQMVRYQFRLALRAGRPGESLPQHLAIIEAIVTGDGPAAEAAVRAHLESVSAELSKSPEPAVV
ncbi:GntR family transcriptional regulator [Streptomyces sp. AD681]|uniref:GntR family transcriptional regulator n=1 Tax=Streptomyces sp. AD681 TaxID=3019069 RepID=UPI0022F177F3|nr:GntR family transcriptional regulator [Streptomyces sp. AD681]MDA5146281.1 GntR family transcriptional regulator [Streptomyces sp. AD681]